MLGGDGLLVSLASLEGEHREQARKLSGFEIFENARGNGLGDKQVILVVNRSQDLTLGVELPTFGVAELIEHLPASGQLLAERPLGAAGAMIGLELSEASLNNFESGLLVEVIHEVGGEVVSRPER